LSIGLSYRSKVDLKVDDGKTEITPSTNTALMNAVNTIMGAGGQSIPPLDKYTFAASMPIPSNINVGAAYHFGENGVITAELQFVGWGAFEQLELNYEAIKYKAVVPKNFSNTIIYRLGGQFTVLPSFDVRLGVYYDTTPVDKDKYYSPETPGSNKLALTCGWSWRPVKAFSVDFAFVYSHGGKIEGKYTGEPYDKAPFTGEYKVHAFLPSLGLSYRF